MPPSPPPQSLQAFVHRHIGPSPDDIQSICQRLGVADPEELLGQVLPPGLATQSGFAQIPAASTEAETLDNLRQIAAQNQPMHNMIGMGYHDVLTPAVLRRNILESPGWYTAYTPYQSEVSQGRLEMLLNFQQMVIDLTALPIANASLLDEATAAAEAMLICLRSDKSMHSRFFADAACLPQTLAVLQTRAEPLGVQLITAPASEIGKHPGCCGYLLQYPASNGSIPPLHTYIKDIKQQGGIAVVAADPLALALLKPPGELGADICIGNSQRLGVPPGYGGPHAAFIAVQDSFKRLLPGRLIGVSRDARGRTALRMALQTREQHIRRERATSNICTAQSLLAILAAARAMYEGGDGWRQIATSVHQRTSLLARGLHRLGLPPTCEHFFDTLEVRLPDATTCDQYLAQAAAAGINLRPPSLLGADNSLGIAVNETTDDSHLQSLLDIAAGLVAKTPPDLATLRRDASTALPPELSRTSACLAHPIFSRYRSETEMMRYLKRLERRDIALDRSMISLGSCTMKLNAAAEMEPISWPAFASLHPFAPPEQAQGYRQLCDDLQNWLADLTGFDAVSLQPNSGAQGEFTGLITIRHFFLAQGETQRNLCLVPRSAHGTNPASAVMAGMEVQVVDCEEDGSVSLTSLQKLVDANADRLAALMLTYPSTHGVFEPAVAQICDIVHSAGGKIYLDGANFNAMLGLCKPREFGADICHLNLHKTFCIPHGGGGPGIGPVATTAELAPWLPAHLPGFAPADSQTGSPVSAAPYGSAGILPISWAFIQMMGGDGLRQAASVAILNANYLATRLGSSFPVLYLGENGRVAHECILDMRPVRKSAGVTEEDIAKRLADYGFHAPTVSFPVAGTMMVEPTESESLTELDRFCDTMISIRREIAAIESGEIPLEQSPLRLAPHSAEDLTDPEWDRPYSRQQAVFPLSNFPPTDRAVDKYWPPVNRIDNPWGDRNLICSCPLPEAWEQGADS